MRKFYKTAGVEASGDSYRITLDDRPVRTPAGATLTVPTLELAQAIAAEWQEQPDPIRSRDMHLTQIATTVADRMPLFRANAVDTLVAYGRTDLVCHRADGPAALTMRQRDAWQPLLDWLETTYGAKLHPTYGVIPVDQPEPALDALRTHIEQLDDHRLIAIQAAAAVLGSLVIALAMAAEHCSASAAFDLSVIDEDFQTERWGVDAEAAAQRAARRHELDAISAYLSMLEPETPGFPS